MANHRKSKRMKLVKLSVEARWIRYLIVQMNHVDRLVINQQQRLNKNQ